MIQKHIFKDGLKGIITFSFDDGPITDIRLVELMNKYGIKSTFHLNSKNHVKPDSAIKLAELKSLYSGHEVAAHTFSHLFLTDMPDTSVVKEVISDRIELESAVGYPVTGMSYPFGAYSKKIIEIMENCGINYSRTVHATRDFRLPTDFMEWHPTCHFKEALQLVDKFFAHLNSSPWINPVFYIWGHSHELKTEEDWQNLEELFKKLSGNENIWYATNIEIFDYVTAQNNLVISADEKIFKNPSAIDVYLEVDGTSLKIPAGKTVTL